jgi:hypothetical protein
MSTRIPSDARELPNASRARDGPSPGARWASGLLARLGHPAVELAAEREHRAVEAGFVGDLLVSRIDPPLRLSPRDRREVGESACDIGASVRYAHLWALDSIAYLYAAEQSAGDPGRWLTAVGGVGLHRYLKWCDERAHFEDASAWARELRAESGSLLSDLYDVVLHEDPAILGGIAARLGLPPPLPRRSLWDIAYPCSGRAARAPSA